MQWYQQAQELVQQAGITQESLMPIFGVSSRGAVGHYLCGRRQPKPEQLKRLADFLGVKIDDFFIDQSANNLDDQAPPATLVRRLQQQNSDAPFGRSYDWSNPGGLSTDLLTLKILRTGRFSDLLQLAKREGIDQLERVAAQHADLHTNIWLQRKLVNIRRGLNQYAA